MSINRLFNAAKVVNKETFQACSFVYEWQFKRDMLVTQLDGLPFMVDIYKNRKKKQHPRNKNVTQVDRIPEIWMASICESIVNTVYSMSEVAARFGNKASNGILPSSFNKLRKKCSSGNLDVQLIGILQDLDSYERIREVRTELAHFSSVFMVEDENLLPELVIRGFRNKEDKIHFTDKTKITMADLKLWAMNTNKMLEDFGEYVLEKYLIEKFDLNSIITIPKYDEDGYPVFIPGENRFEIEETTVGELLSRTGVISPGC